MPCGMSVVPKRESPFIQNHFRQKKTSNCIIYEILTTVIHVNDRILYISWNYLVTNKGQISKIGYYNGNLNWNFLKGSLGQYVMAIIRNGHLYFDLFAPSRSVINSQMIDDV